MGLLLGKDGKRRALEINAGIAVAQVATLYVGLLQSAPDDMDGMGLDTLISAGQGSEFTIDGSFYSGRKPIALGAVTVDKDGAVCHNIGPAIEWTNSTGSEISVAGFFITDVASGSDGQVLWVGTPDAGTATIADTKKAIISPDDLMLKVD